MRIVVVGAGKVGVTLTNILSGEGHDITIIDNKGEVLNETQEMLDVAVVEGNGFLVEVQKVTDEEWAKWKSEYPEAFERTVDPDAGVCLEGWLIGGDPEYKK